MKKVFYPDINKKKEFNRIGYHYARVWGDEDNHIYVYQIRNELPYYQFEVIKAKKVKNPDGNVVYAYPSNDDFGKYGWFIGGNTKNCNLKISQKLSELVGHSVKFECEAIGR